MADCSTLSAHSMQNFAVRFMSVSLLLVSGYPVDAHIQGQPRTFSTDTQSSYEYRRGGGLGNDSLPNRKPMEAALKSGQFFRFEASDRSPKGSGASVLSLA